MSPTEWLDERVSLLRVLLTELVGVLRLVCLSTHRGQLVSEALQDNVSEPEHLLEDDITGLLVPGFSQPCLHRQPHL